VRTSTLTKPDAITRTWLHKETLTVDIVTDHTHNDGKKNERNILKPFVSAITGPGPTYLSQPSLHVFTNHSGAKISKFYIFWPLTMCIFIYSIPCFLMVNVTKTVISGWHPDCHNERKHTIPYHIGYMHHQQSCLWQQIQEQTANFCDRINSTSERWW
jgi:hypothetical protein